MSTNPESLSQPEVTQPQGGGEEHSHDISVEAPAPKEKKIKQPAVTTAPPQVVSVPGPKSPSVSTIPSSSHVPQAQPASLVADDIDLIEKEWVDRAKAIVNATQNDPHKQKKEISKVKAEYIQKRFNKTIKVDTAA